MIRITPHHWNHSHHATHAATYVARTVGMRMGLDGTKHKSKGRGAVPGPLWDLWVLIIALYGVGWRLLAAWWVGSALWRQRILINKRLCYCKHTIIYSALKANTCMCTGALFIGQGRETKSLPIAAPTELSRAIIRGTNAQSRRVPMLLPWLGRADQSRGLSASNDSWSTTGFSNATSSLSPSPKSSRTSSA